MDALLSTEDAATLAAARTILDTLAHAATKAAMHVLGDTNASPDAYDLGCVAQAAAAGKNELQNVLVVVKVFGESEEAGAVL